MPTGLRDDYYLHFLEGAIHVTTYNQGAVEKDPKEMSSQEHITYAPGRVHLNQDRNVGYSPWHPPYLGLEVTILTQRQRQGIGVGHFSQHHTRRKTRFQALVRKRSPRYPNEAAATIVSHLQVAQGLGMSLISTSCYSINLLAFYYECRSLIG